MGTMHARRTRLWPLAVAVCLVLPGCGLNDPRPTSVSKLPAGTIAVIATASDDVTSALAADENIEPYRAHLALINEDPAKTEMWDYQARGLPALDYTDGTFTFADSDFSYLISDTIKTQAHPDDLQQVTDVRALGNGDVFVRYNQGQQADASSYLVSDGDDNQGTGDFAVSLEGTAVCGDVVVALSAELGGEPATQKPSDLQALVVDRDGGEPLAASTLTREPGEGLMPFSETFPCANNTVYAVIHDAPNVVTLQAFNIGTGEASFKKVTLGENDGAFTWTPATHPPLKQMLWNDRLYWTLPGLGRVFSMNLNGEDARAEFSYPVLASSLGVSLMDLRDGVLTLAALGDAPDDDSPFPLTLTRYDVESGTPMGDALTYEWPRKDLHESYVASMVSIRTD